MKRRAGPRATGPRRVGWPRTPVVLAAAVVAALSGCTDGIPTTGDEDRLPIDVQTFEVRVPFSEFGSEVESYSGFGFAANLTTWPLMEDWNGSLDSRVLFRSVAFPDSIFVRPEGQATLVADKLYRPIGAEIFLRLDTLEALGATDFQLSASEITEPWHASTATWEFASDTIGGRVPWTVPGGGALLPIDVATWTPENGDTLTFVVDSARASGWREENDAVSFLIDGETANSRVRVLAAELLIDVRSSVNPDTVVVLSGGTRVQTFIYTPGVEPVDSVMQVGGIPGNRVTMRIDLPETLDPEPEVCAVIDCPVDPDDYQLLYGALVLQTHPAATPALAARDSVAIQVREVLSPDRLPRSPLSGNLHAPLNAIAPGLFDAPNSYEVPLTGYLRSLVQPDSTDAGRSPTVAILGDPEPGDVYLATFHSDESELAPSLRLIFSRSDQVPLP